MIGARACSGALAAGAILLSGCSGGPSSGELAGWNVVLITVDTLRGDRVGFSGWELAETPVMDGLAESGVVFQNAIATAPVTLPSHASILTGLYPPAHGALDNGYYSLPADVPTLATELRRAGYRTGAVVGAYVVHSQYGLGSGFEHYEDSFRQPRDDREAHLERRAEMVTELALEWLGERTAEEPFLLWAHYYDPHSPYRAPQPFRLRFATRPYDGEIAYTDREIGRLLEGLDAEGVRERTLVVLTADHGEGFGDGGERTHGLLLRASTLRVPLVLSAPGPLAAGRRVHGVVSTADVTPTVLDLLGLPPLPRADGKSLLAAIADGVSRERIAYSETRLPENMFGWSMLAGSRSDAWAWVRGPIPELYDLREDPGESRSLHDQRPEAAADMDSVVAAVLGGARNALPNRLSEEDREALRALGYLVGGDVPEPTGADPKERIQVWNQFNDLRPLLGQKRFAEAAAGFEKILEEDPGNREVRMMYGQALVGLGRHEDGIREFQALLDSGTFLGRGGILFARTLAEAGRSEDAEMLLRGFMKTEPKFAEHPHNLGVLMMEQDRWADAREAFERALELNPNAVHVLSNLALVTARGPHSPEDERRALDLIDRAVQLADSDRPSLIKVSVLDALGRSAGARALAEELASRSDLRGIDREEVRETLESLGDGQAGGPRPPSGLQ